MSLTQSSLVLDVGRKHAKTKKDLANLTYVKSTKTINMANVENPPPHPGMVFDRQKALESLVKAAHHVRLIITSATLTPSNPL